MHCSLSPGNRHPPRAGLAFLCANALVLATLIAHHDFRPVFVHGVLAPLPRGTWGWLDTLSADVRRAAGRWGAARCARCARPSQTGDVVAAACVRGSGAATLRTSVGSRQWWEKR